MQKKYTTIGLGGTFDHLHLGHLQLLNCASRLADTVLIGVTSSVFAKTLEKFVPNKLEPYENRLAGVKTYCQQQNISCQLFELHNAFGPTLDDITTVDALCVSEDTVPTAKKINHIRSTAGHKSLPIEVVPLLRLLTGETLSSTGIRQGRFDAAGNILLTSKQRHYFSQPQGDLVELPRASDGKRLMVGDATAKIFLDNNWQFSLGVIDHLIERKPYHPVVIEKDAIKQKTNNPAGQISQELVTAIQTILATNEQWLFVDGEEDLAAVALLFLAPLDSVIYYGQPKTGLVRMVVSESKRQEICKVLQE